MSTKIPSIAVADAIGEHNEELLRNPVTGLMPWEMRIGRLMRRWEDVGRRITRKAVHVMLAAARKAIHVFFAAASQRMEKRR